MIDPIEDTPSLIKDPIEDTPSLIKEPIKNNPILEKFGIDFWRANPTKLVSFIETLGQQNPRESTPQDISPLVELSSDEEMVQEEEEMGIANRHFLELIGLGVVGTGLAAGLYNTEKNWSRNATPIFLSSYETVRNNMNLSDVELANRTGKSLQWVRDTKFQVLREQRWQDDFAIKRGELTTSEAHFETRDRMRKTAEIETAARDSIQEAKINSGDYTNRKIEDIMAKHQVDLAQKPMMEDISFDRLAREVRASTSKRDIIDTERLRRMNVRLDAAKKQFGKASMKARFARPGAGVLAILDMVHILRTFSEADPRDLTEGWEGPWLKEFMIGAGTMLAGGEEGVELTLKNMKAKDLMWYVGAVTGISPKDRLLFIKEIPKSIKDVAVGMVIDPLAWAVEQMPSSEPSLEPTLGGIHGQSTPMGTGQPTRWQ